MTPWAARRCVTAPAAGCSRRQHRPRRSSRVRTPSAGVLEYPSGVADRFAALASTRLARSSSADPGADGDDVRRGRGKPMARPPGIRRPGLLAWVRTRGADDPRGRTHRLPNPGSKGHFTRLLLDMTAIPPPAIALLRARALPPRGPARKPTRGSSARRRHGRG